MNVSTLCTKMIKIGAFFKIELHVSYVHHKKAKIIQKLVLQHKSKVCQEKKQTDIFLNNTKVIAPTVKTQARGQNNLFRALK